MLLFQDLFSTKNLYWIEGLNNYDVIIRYIKWNSSKTTRQWKIYLYNIWCLQRCLRPDMKYNMTSMIFSRKGSLNFFPLTRLGCDLRHTWIFWCVTLRRIKIYSFENLMEMYCNTSFIQNYFLIHTKRLDAHMYVFSERISV